MSSSQVNFRQAVVGYEGLYDVTRAGEVWSLRRGIKMALSPCYYGTYLQVSLVDRDGRPKTHLVHVLVLEAFVGPRPEGYEGCHGPGGCRDNSVENLRWDTRSENRLDTTRHGNNRNANKTHCKRDHPLEGKNLIVQRVTRKDGSTGYQRKCRTCLYASPSRQRRYQK